MRVILLLSVIVSCYQINIISRAVSEITSREGKPPQAATITHTHKSASRFGTTGTIAPFRISSLMLSVRLFFFFLFFCRHFVTALWNNILCLNSVLVCVTLVWKCSSYCLKFNNKNMSIKNHCGNEKQTVEMIQCRKKKSKTFSFFVSFKNELRTIFFALYRRSTHLVESSLWKKMQKKIEVEPKNNFLIYISLHLHNLERLCRGLCNFSVVCWSKSWRLILWLNIICFFLSHGSTIEEKSWIYCGKEWIYGTIKHDLRDESQRMRQTDRIERMWIAQNKTRWTERNDFLISRAFRKYKLFIVFDAIL